MACLVAGCLLTVCLALFSCKKFVTADLPIDKVTAATVFESDETATAAVLGIYSQMMSTAPFLFSGGTTVYGGLSADEFYVTSASAVEDAEFERNSIQPGNGTLWGNFWVRAYRHIYQANACIEKLPLSTALSPAVRIRLLGEAQFIRAFCYFYLVNFFGDVPLVLSTTYETTAMQPRNSVDEVYNQILTDLTAAKAALPAAYATSERIRPNKWAAALLLARVKLYRNDWAGAEAEASEVVSSGVYSLVANLNSVFLAGSTEAVWQLMPVESGFNTTEARYVTVSTTTTTPPTYALTASLLNAFEAGDARKAAWVGVKMSNGQPYNYAFKYKVRNIGLPVTEYYMALRYAEAYLIRAEARTRLNSLNAALADLNVIRARAGLTAASASTAAGLLSAIEKERRIEFMAEWAHRWFDLKRTNRADPVLAAQKPVWQASRALFPVPLSELLRNPALVQNPGY